MTAESTVGGGLFGKKNGFVLSGVNNEPDRQQPCPCPSHAGGASELGCWALKGVLQSVWGPGGRWARPKCQGRLLLRRAVLPRNAAAWLGPVTSVDTDARAGVSAIGA